MEDLNEMAEMDPEELPALLYQLTAISRKCGGNSARLKSLVLTAISEVSKYICCTAFYFSFSGIDMATPILNFISHLFLMY